MNITIIVCTYNRCLSLKNALESVAAMEPPDAGDWEVLVVDNNSRDHTREVVEDFCLHFPGRFRYMFEGRQGKSYALNAGIREASGDVLAFIDDDVTVDPMWLQNLTSASRDPEWAGAGGRILPVWTFAPPQWLSLDSRSALAPLIFFDLGPEAALLTEPPFGTNMAFRKVMFDRYGGFRTDLGPNPANLLRGEDTEFGSRLLAAGVKLRYEPNAIVHHPVVPKRVTKDYFLAWWFDKSRSEILQNGVEPNCACYRGIPLVFLLRLVLWTLRWMVALNPRLRFERKIKVWSNAGLIAECYRRFLLAETAETQHDNASASSFPPAAGKHTSEPFRPK